MEEGMWAIKNLSYKIPQSELKGTQRLNINWLPLVSWQLASDWIPRKVFTLSLDAQVPTLVRSTSGTAVLYQNSSRASKYRGELRTRYTDLDALRDLPSSFSKCWKQNSLAIPRNWCLEWHICMYMCIYKYMFIYIYDISKDIKTLGKRPNLDAKALPPVAEVPLGPFTSSPAWWLKVLGFPTRLEIAHNHEVAENDGSMAVFER